MCRLIAYCGPSIPLENVIVRPRHSLVIQSQLAEEAKLAVNGDGFGLAWYDTKAENTSAQTSCPALYKEVMPAWANPNLLHLCRSIQAENFLAHVRASTFGEASYQNCHPFAHGAWSFAHNGQIGGFGQLRRPLENRLPDHLFQQRLGITDSELLFLLIVSHGLEQSPQRACRDAIAEITRLHVSLGIKPAIKLTFVLSNGNSLIGCRYSSNSAAPTLYLSKSTVHGGTVLASEPLDGDRDNWTMIAPNSLIEVDRDRHRNFKVDDTQTLAA